MSARLAYSAASTLLPSRYGWTRCPCLCLVGSYGSSIDRRASHVSHAPGALCATEVSFEVAAHHAVDLARPEGGDLDFWLDVFGYTPTRDQIGPPADTARSTGGASHGLRYARLIPWPGP